MTNERLGTLAQALKNMEIIEALVSTTNLLLQQSFDESEEEFIEEPQRPVKRATKKAAKRVPAKKVAAKKATAKRVTTPSEQAALAPSHPKTRKQIPHNNLEMADMIGGEEPEEEKGANRAKEVVRNIARNGRSFTMGDVRDALLADGFEKSYTEGSMYHVVKGMVKRGELIKEGEASEAVYYPNSKTKTA